jgi:hypothetical protein
VRIWTVKRAIAIAVAGALAMDAATPLYAQLRSSEKAVGHVGSNDRSTPDRFLMLGAPSGSGTVTPASASRDKVAEDRQNHNKGPDVYFAPTYRDGKCVEDEGNTLVAEPTFGGGVRRIEGKSLERALELLCRKAALER